jgi:hypothetical protein
MLTAQNDHGQQTDLEEALDALDLMDRALEQSIGDGFLTGLQISAMAALARLRRKHNRELCRGSSVGATSPSTLSR